MLLRFAPSPTGYIHIGNARTALMCFLYAKKNSGKLLLRIDDTDTERSKEEYVDALKNDLHWLGIEFDDQVRQSSRFDRYNEVIEQLKERGILYPCYETPEDLNLKRKICSQQNKPFIYDRSALKLTQNDRKTLEYQGLKPHFRLKIEDNIDITWEDEIRGCISFNTSNISDPIVIRENGLPTYMLPSAIDDIDMSITHIFRGEDHISNTAIQIYIMNLMNAPVPKFAHISFLQTSTGNLSKRKGDNSILDLRKQYICPMAISSYLAKIGTSEPVRLFDNMNNLIQDFDISKMGKSKVNIDYNDIKNINIDAIKQMNFDEISPFIKDIPKSSNYNEDFWNIIRENIEEIDKDLPKWYEICYSNELNIENNAFDKEFLTKALKFIPEGEWNINTWKKWTTDLKNSTSKKGKELFLPLRKAISGEEKGPEMKNLILIMGKQLVEKRIRSLLDK